MTKDGHYDMHGITEEELMEVGKKKEPAWAQVAKSTNYEAACEAAERLDPKSWFNNGERIRANLRHKFPVDMFPPYQPNFNNVEEPKTPENLQRWLDEEFTKEPGTRPKCLFMIGSSKLGKTHWARSVVDPHVYWKGMVNLDKWNPDAKLLICDDIDWEYMPCAKSYLTAGGEAEVTDKYRKKKTINVNMPAMFLCNDMPKRKDGVALCQDDYWNANGVFEYVYDKLY